MIFFYFNMTDRAFKSARVGVIGLYSYKNLIIGLVIAGILGVVYGISFNVISKVIPIEILFWFIIGIAFLSGFGISILFPVFKEKKKETI